MAQPVRTAPSESAEADFGCIDNLGAEKNGQIIAPWERDAFTYTTHAPMIALDDELRREGLGATIRTSARALRAKGVV